MQGFLSTSFDLKLGMFSELLSSSSYFDEIQTSLPLPYIQGPAWFKVKRLQKLKDRQKYI